MLRELREVLVGEWSSPISMETILFDAGLDARKYMIDAPRSEDRWAHALRRIDRDNKLIRLISAVRDHFDRENAVIERLYAAEQAGVRPAPVKPDPGDSVTAAPGSLSVGGIFLNYRRDDTTYVAGWLFERLVSHFGQIPVFKDIDSILPGDDFTEKIKVAIDSCAILLALMGNRWLAAADASGQPRLVDPGDFVRMEIEAALRRNVRVVPVLVEGARMPTPAELPSGLAALAHRQAFELSSTRFGYDTGRLLSALDRMLSSEEPA
jgi:hypothetical protein